MKILAQAIRIPVRRRRDRRCAAPAHTEHVGGFPQVVIIAADGKTVEQRDGAAIGAAPLNRHIHDIYLADGRGHGLLKFHATAGAPPADLFRTVRDGCEVLHAELGPMSAADRYGLGGMIVSVDEANRAAWVRDGNDGPRPSAMDRVATPSMCWLEYELGSSCATARARR